MRNFFLPALVSIFVWASCSKAPDTPAVIVPEVLKINQRNASVLTGENIRFTLKYINEMAIDTTPPASVVWSSGNNNIATINQQGIATGVGAGQVYIFIRYKNIVDSALLSVAQSTPERLVLNEQNGVVAAGSTFAFTVKYFNPAGQEVPPPGTITWGTDNSNVATISPQGLATGVAAGQTTITARYNNASASTTLTVTAPVSLESLQIVETGGTVNVGSTITFTLRYTNPAGVVTSPPTGVMWSSNNATIATVSNSGVVTGVAAGQTSIRATLNTLTSSVPVAVVNSNIVSSVTLLPANLLEMKLGESSNIVATAFNSNGQSIPGATFTWQSDNSNFVTVSNVGRVTATGYGTANVTATAMGVQSNPLMVQVIRVGSFSGFGSTGMGKLKIENGALKLQTTADFSVSTGAPDLRIYLTNNTSSISSAVEIATLNVRSGAQSWIVPNTVSITQYRYIMVWCRQFGGNYGTADLGL
jgi:uncharacterized protein YjdB